MSAALENRLKRLEKAAIPPGESIDLICIRLVSPGGRGEVIRADLGDGILDRHAGMKPKRIRGTGEGRGARRQPAAPPPHHSAPEQVT